jgi:DNA-binding NarL/FixJ family response regulator
VLNYLVRGRSVQSIAEATILSVNTVKSHTHHIHQKLAVHTREELIILVEQMSQSKRPD